MAMVDCALSALLVLSLTGCSGQLQEPPAQPYSDTAAAVDQETGKTQTDAVQLDALTRSYYAAQSSKAFTMLQRSIFKDLLVQWTEGQFQNPVWNYETFTKYERLNDEGGAAAAQTEELYFCAFTADHDAYGYMIISRQGAGLTRVEVTETPYLFDLQENLGSIAAGLGETQLDFATAKAVRVRLVGTEAEDEETIRVTDDKGHDYLCYFGESTVDRFAEYP